jgi:hypothetical protein
MAAKKDAAKLPGWITLAELAERLGVSKQAVDQMAKEGRIATLCWASTGSGRRPLWLLREDEVAELSGPVAAAARSRAVSIARGERQPVSATQADDSERAGETNARNGNGDEAEAPAQDRCEPAVTGAGSGDS